MIQQQGENLIVKFAPPFSMEKYDVFLKAKRLPESNLTFDYETGVHTIETHSRYANLLGIEATAALNDALNFPAFLFEHQSEIVKLALAAKRYAVWANVGLGKTLIELEFDSAGCENSRSVYGHRLDCLRRRRTG